MKKFILVIALALFLNIPVASATFDLAPSSRSAYLMDALTKEVLFEKNSDERLAPASMTKLMTMVLVYEDIINGGLSFDEVLSVSENAASMGGSQIFLEAGEQMSVRDLFKAMAIGSANDASVALAERVGGTEENFIEMMNAKAEEMNLVNTHFMNPHGLDEDEHYSSAKDMAILGAYLTQYPEILEYTSTYEDYLRQDTDDSFWLVNTNKLVRFVDEVDGIKTGYTPDAGFCLTASAIKDDFRVIAVVMGAPSSRIRNGEITKMIKYAFQQFEYQEIYPKGEIIGETKVYKGIKDNAIFGIIDPIKVVKSRGGADREITTRIKLEDVIAPIEKNRKIGTIELYEGNQKIASYDLVVFEDLERATILDLFAKYLKIMISGI